MREVSSEMAEIARQMDEVNLKERGIWIESG